MRRSVRPIVHGECASRDHAQQDGGAEIIIPFPSKNAINAMIDAGAETRSWGGERWLHVETGQHRLNPGDITLFILRGRS